MRIMVPSRPKKPMWNPNYSASEMSLLQYGTIQWTDKLIELVLENQALYNHAHPDYRNIARRDTYWEEIAVKLQTTPEDIKKRWRSLRDTYSRIIRNRHKKGVPERGKKWTWSDKMEPLLGFLPTSTFGDDMDSSNLLEVQFDDSSTTQDSTLDYSRRSADGNDENDDAEINPASSSTGKRPYPSDSEDRPSVVYFSNGKKAKMDPIDLLFLAHASTVRTFSPRRQAIAKLRIAEVIMQEELRHHEDLGITRVSPKQGSE